MSDDVPADSRWLVSELGRFLGLNNSSEELDQALGRLDEATTRFAGLRVAHGELLYVRIDVIRGGRTVHRSFFRDLPHPGVLLGVGVKMCQPGDVLSVEQVLSGPSPSSYVQKRCWPVAFELTEMMVRPAAQSS